ncbi:hypothetical protein ABFX02_07G096500 [Erythranthe guttata]
MSVTQAADEFITMETRDASPSHFFIKFESFYKSGIDKYETKEFAAGEYKCVGLNNDYISVYLAMADTNSLPANWEVNAVFSICLLNHNSGNYLSSLGRTRRFQGVKSEWGFPKFISKKVMSDPSNGYLYGDSCVLGAEVFVVKREPVIEYVCLKNFDVPHKREWKIQNFSKLGDEWKSGEFSVGGHKWKICLYPKGYGEETGRYVSIFLQTLGSENVKASFTICIKNQLNDLKHQKKTCTDILFTASEDDWGSKSFIELATINDPKMGFIVNDCCVLDVEISSVQDA